SKRDWSSDVCSSDLRGGSQQAQQIRGLLIERRIGPIQDAAQAGIAAFGAKPSKAVMTVSQRLDYGIERGRIMSSDALGGDGQRQRKVTTKVGEFFEAVARIVHTGALREQIEWFGGVDGRDEDAVGGLPGHQATHLRPTGGQRQAGFSLREAGFSRRQEGSHMVAIAGVIEDHKDLTVGGELTPGISTLIRVDGNAVTGHAHGSK